DLRLALTFAPPAQRAALTTLFAVYLEIREVPVECRDPGVAAVKLGWWEDEVEALYRTKPRHPLTQALAPYLASLASHKQAFLDLVAGTRMDVTGSQFASFEDLKRYCYRHSGALAEITAALCGGRSKEALLSARLLGNSCRLAHLVTSGIPEALEGRLYFATEDLRRHGVDRHINAEHHSDAPVQALLEDYAERARAMGFEAAALLPASDRISLAAWRILHALALKRVAKLEARGFRTAAKPVELHPLPALFTAWRTARRAG
ncbi:MAG TPA: squalene/phytoene synthase family protein, partial [Gammaproteobacteria bacterium]|nr:squalene/phytoene synthase family protein [Gammaproteobacteria bacterium]